MTPRQRAYALAAERGVVLAPDRFKGLLWGVVVWWAHERVIANRVRFDRAKETARQGWRRVCAVLEAMPAVAQGGADDDS